MHLHDILDNLRSQPGPTRFATEDLVGEQALLDLRRHTPPGVFHLYDNMLVIWSKFAHDGDRPAGRNLRNGIIHQVVESVK